MWAKIFFVALCGSGVIFLLYFELAMFRELRGTHKRPRLIYHPHTDPRSVDNEPRVIKFPVALENNRKKQKRVAQ